MTWRRSVFFLVLYFVQGVALAYFTGFQKRYLMSAGVSGDRIAWISGLVIAPFILKPFLGLIADSLAIRRKPAIALGLGLAALAFGSAAMVNPASEFYLFSALMITASVGVAIFDTVSDALAVDAFSESEFGPLQSAMLTGKSVGLILFSIVFGVLIDSVGYENVFAFLCLAMFVPFTIWKSVASVPRKRQFEWSAFRVLIKDYVAALAVFGVIYSIPSFGVSGLFAYYFSTLGYSAAEGGRFEALKSIGAVVGAISFAALVRRFDLRKIAVAATLAAVAIRAGFTWSVSAWYLGCSVALFGVVWALRETIYMTLAMKITQPAIAATMFSLLMAFSNLGTSIGEGWATAAAGRSGFAYAFVLFGLMNIAGLWYFYPGNLVKSRATVV